MAKGQASLRSEPSGAMCQASGSVWRSVCELLVRPTPEAVRPSAMTTKRSVSRAGLGGACRSEGGGETTLQLLTLVNNRRISDGGVPG